MFVGNNWDGTADVVDAHTYEKIKRIDIVPDKDERMAEIQADPVRLGYYLAIQQEIGEGHDQYVDDMFSTRDGTLLAVSRPSFADVVWIDLASGKIVKRQPMDGYRADHMGVSPDRRRLLVSDSTSGTVHEYVLGGADNPRTGKRLRTFAVRGDAAREQLLRRRQPDLPREHRQGLHTGRLRRARSGDRPGQGRPVVPGRPQQGLQDHAPLGHGQGAGGGRLQEHELRGPADGDLAGRAVRLLPGVVLPRLRRVRPEGQGPHRRRRLHRRRQAGTSDRTRSPGSSRCPTASPTCRASSTSSTPRTTAWR